ncbi:hypothetical protein F5884DRAFT_398493 [Xylogone sp. PMI_703]|nr:hypothetical protein F5884DRAFT_398493 [Xylogone sp. PMI_703]
MAPPSDPIVSPLTPGLLHSVFENRIHYPAHEHLDFSEVYTKEFVTEDGLLTEELRQICYPVLKYLSTLGVDNVPDLIHFLPSPENDDFPVQAFGLQLLLDQAPRVLFKGMDARYTNGYFDIISQKLAKQLRSLPKELRMDAQARWLGERGVTFGYWVVLKLYAIAPFVHSEHLSDQKMASELLEEARESVAQHTGKLDPYKNSKAKPNIHTFAALYSQGPAGWKEGKTTMEDFAFWLWALMDSRRAIIEKFGRLPYLNETMGRINTDEEERWIEESRKGTGGDGAIEAHQEVQRKIREDVLQGRWTPLGGEVHEARNE